MAKEQLQAVCTFIDKKAEQDNQYTAYHSSAHDGYIVRNGKNRNRLWNAAHPHPVLGTLKGKNGKQIIGSKGNATEGVFPARYTLIQTSENTAILEITNNRSGDETRKNIMPGKLLFSPNRRHIQFRLQGRRETLACLWIDENGKATGIIRSPAEMDREGRIRSDLQRLENLSQQIGIAPEYMPGHTQKRDELNAIIPKKEKANLKWQLYSEPKYERGVYQRRRTKINNRASNPHRAKSTQSSASPI